MGPPNIGPPAPYPLLNYSSSPAPTLVLGIPNKTKAAGPLHLNSLSPKNNKITLSLPLSKPTLTHENPNPRNPLSLFTSYSFFFGFFDTLSALVLLPISPQNSRPCPHSPKKKKKKF